MARFFKAPVVDIAQYGRQLPFEQLKYALDTEQAKYDQSKKALAQLYDVGQLDALDHHQGRRKELLQQRYEEADKILYNEDGSMRDLRTASGMIQAEARRRAKEEQAGGEWYNIGQSFLNRQKEIEYNSELRTKEKITGQRADEVNQFFFGDYQQRDVDRVKKDKGKVLNVYQGTKAESQVNLMEIGNKFAEKVKSNQFLSGVVDIKDLVTEKGRLAFDANDATLGQLAQLSAKSGGAYQYILDRGYLQSGDVEYVAFNEAYNAASAGIINDPKAIAMLRQEAIMSGAKTQDEVKTFIQNAVNNAAIESAHTFSFTHYDANLKENWIKREAYKAKKARDLAAFVKSEKNHVFQWKNPVINREVSSKEIFENLHSKQVMVQQSQEVINEITQKYKNSDGDIDWGKMGAEDKAAYLSAKNQNAQAKAGVRKLKKVQKDILKKVSDEDIKNFVSAGTFWNGPVYNALRGAGQQYILDKLEQMDPQQFEKLREAAFKLQNNYDNSDGDVVEWIFTPDTHKEDYPKDVQGVAEALSKILVPSLFVSPYKRRNLLGADTIRDVLSGDVNSPALEQGGAKNTVYELAKLMDLKDGNELINNIMTSDLNALENVSSSLTAGIKHTYEVQAQGAAIAVEGEAGKPYKAMTESMVKNASNISVVDPKVSRGSTMTLSNYIEASLSAARLPAEGYNIESIKFVGTPETYTGNFRFIAQVKTPGKGGKNIIKPIEFSIKRSDSIADKNIAETAIELISNANGAESSLYKDASKTVGFQMLGVTLYGGMLEDEVEQGTTLTELKRNEKLTVAGIDRNGEEIDTGFVVVKNRNNDYMVYLNDGKTGDERTFLRVGKDYSFKGVDKVYQVLGANSYFGNKNAGFLKTHSKSLKPDNYNKLFKK